jgi:hypothetical protein
MEDVRQKPSIQHIEAQLMTPQQMSCGKCIKMLIMKMTHDINVEVIASAKRMSEKINHKRCKLWSLRTQTHQTLCRQTIHTAQGSSDPSNGIICGRQNNLGFNRKARYLHWWRAWGGRPSWR